MLRGLPILLSGALAGLFPHGAARALEWQTEPGGRSARLTVAVGGSAGFTLVAPEVTGLRFTNELPEWRHLTNQILLNGAGVAAGDVDGDGWCDLYFCCLHGANRLFRNLGGWKFADITASAGVACANLTATGAAFADLDGDGDLDLVVNSLGNGTRVFWNDGQGHFTEAATLLNRQQGGMSLALADVDGDGFLDLYVANYRTSALMDMPNARATFMTVDGRPTIATLNGRPLTEPDLTNRFRIGPRGAIEEQGQADVLYRNLGGTNFVEVPFTDGAFLDEDGQPLTAPPLDWGLTAMFHDLNHDGLPDLYVCNDFQTPDRCWINQGAGRFRLAPRLAQRKTSLFSMAVDFADINRDGHDDFLVLDMLSREHQQRMRYLSDLNPCIPRVGVFDDRPQYGLNTLFLNRGDGTFAEIAQLSGLQAAEWSWSCVFLDVDLDGWEDVLVVNGMERAARDMDVVEQLKQLRASRRLADQEVFQARRMFPRLATANLAFRNRGDLTFEEVGRTWGFDWKGVSQGMALADLDNDGDLDVVVNNLNAPAGLYRNNSPAPRLAVRLKGAPPNTRGIGARIIVKGGSLPVQSQEMIAGGRYLSGDDPIRSFAAGAATNRLRLEVHWRSGRRSALEAVPDRLYELDEALATTNPPPPQAEAPTPPLFEDVTDRLAHVHHEEEYDDFARQPLLPNKLSQLGPGVAWFDCNGDGWDDLLIASGKGGALALFQNDGRGHFQPWLGSSLFAPASRDQTTVLGWLSATNRPLVLVGLANYEDGLATGPALERFDLAKRSSDDPVPATESSTGPLALGDIDADGDLDLFVGGRVIGGKYPQAASSRLFRNHQGNLVPDHTNQLALADVGLVSGAVFTDLDGDGYPELVLACEWGPLRILRNNQGVFREWDPPVTSPGQRSNTLSRLTGWWNSVSAGDFDGDGRLDLVAGNWGRNTKYEPYRPWPLEVLYGDFDGDGTLDLVEAHYDAGLRKRVPERQLDTLAASLPFLRERFTSHRAYGLASVEDVLGERLRTAKAWNATWLETSLFLNRGDHFDLRALPVEAQMAPAFGLVIADADGDGAEDIFLAQNFFGAEPQTPRYDAGRGLWLKGDGQGGFFPLSGQVSGVTVYGEQRGAAAADFDGDGRTDLVVTQNGAATRLFRNAGAKPGLRVRLLGPPANPAGIGSVLRVQWAGGSGPARELHAGAGYWSQDSACQILAAPPRSARVSVRWPGGGQSVVEVPAGAKEVTVLAPPSVRAGEAKP